MYDVLSADANHFIHNYEIIASLNEGKRLATDTNMVDSILDKAKSFHGLNHREAAVLMEVSDASVLEEIYSLANQIKEHIYGRRIVMFAPLYLSDYCTNSCAYCGYSTQNKNARRRRLSQDQLREEVKTLEKLGHKRLALETGEDPVHCSLDYVIESINTIYSQK
jgi:2-iminoacetate synthase